MLPVTLPPPTASLRAHARPRCAETYTPVMPLNVRALDGTFSDVIAGSATFYVYVDEAGRPIAAQVVRDSDETFLPAALQALAAWHFRPATCGGRPIVGRYTAVFNG